MYYKIGVQILLFFLLQVIISCCPKVIYTAPEGPVFSGNFSPAQIPATDTIKVVSFNIEYGEKIDQAILELATVPDLKKAQIILLQEIDELGVEKMARFLNMDYVYYPTAIHTYERNFGEAVLTKGTIKEYFKVVLPHRNPICHQKRIVVMAIINMGGISILAGSLHLEVAVLSVDKRVDQASAVLKAVPDSIDHIILGGDYNSLLQSTIDLLDTIAGRSGYKRATENIDYSVASAPFGWFKFNLDHIFVKGFVPQRSGSYKKSTASDHYPVWVILKKE